MDQSCPKNLVIASSVSSKGEDGFSKGVLILSHLIGGRDVAAVPPSAGRPPVGPTFTVGEITLTAAGGGLTGDE